MASHLFGTDGVRGIAGEYPLDRATVARLGAAIVRALPHDGPPHVLVGRDTRASGPWLEAELARGIGSAGGRTSSIGVVPTPAVAYLTGSGDFDAGLVISASHNPYQDNGIKVFSGRGHKFDGQFEQQVEALVSDTSWAVDPAAPAGVEPLELVDRYLNHVRLAYRQPPRSGRARIAVDCANGATSFVAARLFESLGFGVTTIHAEPDGRNINAACGSTHPESLADLVKSGAFLLGAAFDGDGDRVILVDPYGRIVDGDAVMYICARYLQSKHALAGNAIVATVMSNIGLELKLRELGIGLVRCPVGDKNVMEELVGRRLSLGGEQSGHIIFTDYLATGDGLLTAVFVLNVLVDTGKGLDELAGELVTYPQVLLNVRVRERRNLDDLPDVVATMARVEARLAGRGRLLVRYSGTEPLLRIMIEGENHDEIRSWAEEVGASVRATLG